MVVKFKVGMTISAETVFSILARLLPIENLTVEEVLERPHPIEQFTPRLKHMHKVKRKSAIPMRLDAGINRIILEFMADGKRHRANDIRPLLIAGGYSANSIGSRMQALQVKGILKQWGDGTWSKVP